MGHEVMKKKNKQIKIKKKKEKEGGGESGSVGHEVKDKNKKKRGKKVWEMKCWQWKSQNTEGNLEFFRVRLFWVKMISGNHFPPNQHVWLQRKMKFSGNSLPVDRNLRL